MEITFKIKINQFDRVHKPPWIIYIAAQDSDGKKIPEDDIISEIQTFFMAGQETVATGMGKKRPLKSGRIIKMA